MTYQLCAKGAHGELSRGHGSMWDLVEDAVALGMAHHSQASSPTDDASGIPAHKLSSNDGWHVTRVECHQAVMSYDEAITGGAEHPESFGDDLVPFLRHTATHDGFEVF